MKKLLALVIALAMILTTAVVFVSAEEEDEPDAYFWISIDSLPSNPQVDMTFKVPGELIADADVTFTAVVKFGEDITGGGFGYVNCYSYYSEEHYRDFSYLICWNDFATSTKDGKGEWKEVSYTMNPYTASYSGANNGASGGKSTPEFVAMGVGFYNATGTVYVQSLSASQNGKVIWSIDFADDLDLTQDSTLLPSNNAWLNCTEEDRGTIWDVVTPTVDIGDTSEPETGEPTEPSEPAQPIEGDNVATGMNYTVEGNNLRNDNYDDNDSKKLTDGIVGIEASAADLLGFKAGDDGVVSVTLDLGEVKDFGSIVAYAVHYDGWGIPAPTSVTFSVSEDGETYGTEIEVTVDEAGVLAGTGTGEGWDFPTFVANGDFTGRYVKIDFNRNGAGHVWVSEVEIIAEAAAPVDPDPVNPDPVNPDPVNPDPDVPQNGDAGIIALAVISVIALGGAVIVKKSK